MYPNEELQKAILYRVTYPENNINLLRAYGIPIPQGEPKDWSAADVTKIIKRLKDIRNNIDWYSAIFNGHTSEAVGYVALLEAIAGKQYMWDLANIVFNS